MPSVPMTAPKRPLGVKTRRSERALPAAPSMPILPIFSTPTTSATSASPAWMARCAIRTAVAPVAHALKTL